MGGVCTLVREPGPDDDWIYEENSTFIFNDVQILLTDFEASILNKNACKSSWSKFEPATQASLTSVYLMLIIFGSVGNGLVCYVVLANCHMRTPRNLLILNLATSDLILCLFTQPFNLLKASTSAWKMGTLMCKLVPMVAGTNVFVSTFSITAIALDRFKLIVRPTDKDLLLQPVWSTAVLLSIWILSLFLSSPMLVFNTLLHVKPTQWLCVKELCFEDPQYSDWKAAYSIASMLIQYIVPIMVLSVAHARICNKLQNRMTVGNQAPNRNLEASRPIKQRILFFPWSSSTHSASGDQQKNDETEVSLADKTTEICQSTLKREVTEAKVASNACLQTTSLEVPPPAGQQSSSESFENLDSIQQISSTPLTQPPSSLNIRAQQVVKSLSPSKRLWFRSEPTEGASESLGRSGKARKKRADRERKTNRLLMMIALVFAGSWMPLNIINIIADLNPDLITNFDETGVVFAVCHLLVLGSACANPVLYGWLNENFRREFKRILCVQCKTPSVKLCCGCCSRNGKQRVRISMGSGGFNSSNQIKKALTASGPPTK